MSAALRKRLFSARKVGRVRCRREPARRKGVPLEMKTLL